VRVRVGGVVSSVFVDKRIPDEGLNRSSNFANFVEESVDISEGDVGFVGKMCSSGLESKSLSGLISSSWVSSS